MMERRGSGHPRVREVTSDAMDAATQRRVFDRDPIAWLAGQAIHHLHAANPDEESAFRHTVHLLRHLPDATRTIAQVFHDAPRDDHSLRWALLYLLAEVGDPSAAEVFFKAAAMPVPPREHYAQGCETPRDGELLVATMAIAGLQRIGNANHGVLDMLYSLLEVQTERALRIEVVKALLALDPDGVDRIKRILPQELHFALEIRRVRAEALSVEYEARPADKVRFAPILGTRRTPPATSPCGCR